MLSGSRTHGANELDMSWICGSSLTQATAQGNKFNRNDRQKTKEFRFVVVVVVQLLIVEVVGSLVEWVVVLADDLPVRKVVESKYKH